MIPRYKPHIRYAGKRKVWVGFAEPVDEGDYVYEIQDDWICSDARNSVRFHGNTPAQAWMRWAEQRGTADQFMKALERK